MTQIHTFGCYQCGELHAYDSLEEAEFYFDDFKQTACVGEKETHWGVSIVTKDKDKVF